MGVGDGVLVGDTGMGVFVAVTTIVGVCVGVAVGGTVGVAVGVGQGTSTLADTTSRLVLTAMLW